MYIRCFKNTDYHAIAELVRHCKENLTDFIPQPYSTTVYTLIKEFQLCNQDPSKQMYVICNNRNKVIGFCGVDPHFRTSSGFLDGPVIHQQYRRNGYGTLLLNLIINLAIKKYKLYVIRAGVGSYNRNGISFLKHHRFKYKFSTITMRCNSIKKYTLDKVNGLEFYQLHQENEIDMFYELFISEFPSSWKDRQYFCQKLKDPDVYIIIARNINGSFIGFIQFTVVRNNTLWISHIAVNKEHRGKGIATRLLKEAMNRAYECNIKTAELEVRCDNTFAIRLYSRYGFIQQNKFLTFEREISDTS